MAGRNRELETEVASYRATPGETLVERQKLEQRKLQEEIAKLQAEVIALQSGISGPGKFLPWLQVLGVGSVIGGMLVLFAGQSLGRVQRDKLKQDVEFADQDHKLQQEKLKQDILAAREDHAWQAKKLRQEMGINRSQHSLKLFEALGAPDARIRIGAASELGQRVRELNDELNATDSLDVDRRIAERERQAIIRVLIAVTKHEDREELQKHIADLIVDLVGARTSGMPNSPLVQYDFQGAKLSMLGGQGVDARGVDFYKVYMPKAGLANSRLSNAIFKGADMTNHASRG